MSKVSLEDFIEAVRELRTIGKSLENFEEAENWLKRCDELCEIIDRFLANRPIKRNLIKVKHKFGENDFEDSNEPPYLEDFISQAELLNE